MCLNRDRLLLGSINDADCRYDSKVLMAMFPCIAVPFE